MSSEENTQQSPSLTSIDGDALALLKQDLDLRKNELLVREKEASAELQVRQSEIESNNELAKASIEANLKVELERKSAFIDLIAKRYSAVKWGIVALSIVVIVGMYLGEVETVKEIISALVVISGTAFGAYNYGQNKANEKIANSNRQEAEE